MRAMAAAGGIADAGRSASLEQRLAALEARLAAGGGGGERPGGDVAADMDVRLSSLESSVHSAVTKQGEMAAVSAQMESLQSVLSKLATEIASMKAGGGGAPDGAAPAARLAAVEAAVADAVADMRVLSARLDATQAAISSLQADVKRVPSAAGAADGVTMATLEKKMVERQSRFEGALMQVARQVDLLDSRLRDEQESSLKALESLLAQSGLQTGGKGGLVASPRMTHDQGPVPL
uniref:Uncharacterized protein n=1 Tax=Chlamydomonas euryale TaxID=1486919 RepID=A0A7R9V496_9CHLO|mmetsp:Transcript_17268/g.51878  ORF Transcript_17268/g.51878 Transcript_17268/m.51878 type:complete len:236 (+) Transcript_17268:2-709(+)